MIQDSQKREQLFDLSLAVGQSPDAANNCRHFLQALLQLEGVKAAGIWLKREGEALKLVCSRPAGTTFHVEEESLAEVLKSGAHRSDKSSMNSRRDFFPLAKIGLLLIVWDKAQSPLSEAEFEVLMRVNQKLAVSLEGSLSYERLKSTENRLRATERKQQQIIETSLDAVILVDGNACVQEWGPKAQQLFQLTAEEAIGQRWYKLVVPYREWEEQDRHLERFQRFGEFPAEQFAPLEITAIDRSGREFPAEMSYSYLDLEGEAHFCLFIRDISKRKASEAELLKAQTRLRALISNLQAGILVENENRRIVLVNQYFCDIFKVAVPPTVLLGQDCSLAAESFKHLFKDPEGFVKGIDDLIARREVKTREVLHFKDGRVYERDYIPIYVEGEYLGHMWQYRDVTKQKHRENELRKAKRTAEASKQAERKFLTSMSHEIRTPINTVIGMIHLLNDTRLDESQREYLEALRFSADSLLGIINNILDLSKIEAGELSFEAHTFHLNKLLEAIRKSCKLELANKPVEVHLTIDPAIDEPLIGDSTRLSQILNNLMNNAVKFTEEGRIDLEVNVMEDRPDSFLLEFVVRDTGIGIPTEQIPMVFENFKQIGEDVARKYGGTGLGLSIVKQLVELQGGQISVESNANQGSLFRFTLAFDKGPKGDRPENSVTIEEAPLSASLEHLHMLVVEDDPMNRLLIRRIFDRWQCSYHLASNRKKTDELLRQSTYDLILMDLHMPGFIGYKMVEQLRDEQHHPNRHTPVVAVTAAALLEERNRALKAGVNDILTKPFSPEALYQVIVKWTTPGGRSAARMKKGHRQEDVDGGWMNFRYLYNFSQGDEGFIREMVEAFLEETPEGLEEMALAAENEDWEALYQVAHRLKPSYEMMELNELKSKLEALENLSKAETVDEREVKELLEEITEKSRQELEKIRRML